RYFFLHVWSQGRSIMKHALIAIAGVGILATTVGVETANAQYSPPPPPSYAPPPAYTPAPAYSPAPAYTPAPRYIRRPYRRSARQTYSAPAATAYTPGSGPPPYSVTPQTYAAQSSGPWEWHAGPGPKKRRGMCV